MEEWPISRDFVREIPEEEKRASGYVNHKSLSLLGEKQDEDLSPKGHQELPVMAFETGAVLKNDVRRNVLDLVVHQSREEGLTGRCEDSQRFQLNERPAEGDAATPENRFRPENIIRLREILNSVMLRTNK